MESASETEPTDWKRYEPPKELLKFPGIPLEEIRRIFPESIERVRARHLEEENKRRAAARPERLLARKERVYKKPQLEVS